MGAAWWIPWIAVVIHGSRGAGGHGHLRKLSGEDQCRLRATRLLPTPSLDENERKMGAAWWIPWIAVVIHGSRGAGGHGHLRKLSGEDQCRLRATRLLPTPSLDENERCLIKKWASNTTHDWSVAGAETEAFVDCWCSLNMTQAITDLDCCGHPNFQQYCRLDCEPDCQNNALATECYQECPAMCFEAREYLLPRDLCKRCNPSKCFPVLKCMLQKAQDLTESGELERTCHETDFFNGGLPVLEKYWQCWKDMPKHSTHWNVLSAWIHCSCREGMINLANQTDCCKSLTYGGGICEAQCPSERECVSQEAQTCIHNCNELCTALDISPSSQCRDKCLSGAATCRKYLGCRTPMLTASSYVCDDGKWPEGNSGCCVSDSEGGQVTVGCPSLCETKLMYRVDNPGIPWWATRSQTVVYQCTCDGCPALEDVSQVKQTVEENIWDNGQDLLVDVARREGLKLGPNRKMQELMMERNEKIVEASKGITPSNRQEVETRIENINTYYTHQITQAAREYGDDGSQLNVFKQREEEMLNQSAALAGLLAGALGMVVVLIVVVLLLVRRRRREQDTPVTVIGQNETVVIGSPVPLTGQVTAATKEDGVVDGAAVTVSAPARAGKAP